MMANTIALSMIGTSCYKKQVNVSLVSNGITAASLSTTTNYNIYATDLSWVQGSAEELFPYSNFLKMIRIIL